MLTQDRRSPAAVLVPLTIVLIGTIGSTSQTAPNNRISYIAFIAMLGMFAWSEWRAPLRRFVALRPYDAVPAILLAVWAYGFVLGIARGIPLRYVVSNFAGMTAYSVYYVLLVRQVRKFALLRCAIVAGLVNAAYAFGFFVWDKTNTIFHRFMSVRDYYSETLALVAVPLVLLIYRQFWTSTLTRRRAFAEGALACFLLFVILQTSLSKSIMLSVGALLLCIFLFSIRRLLQPKAKPLATVLLWLSFAVVAYSPVQDVVNTVVPIPTAFEVVTKLAAKLKKSAEPMAPVAVQVPATAPTSPAPPAPKVRSSQEPDFRALELQSQSTRADQSVALSQDLNFWGHGLGAPLSSGYSRDTAGYGFEQNYQNLIHKFGVFALIIFAVYLLIIGRIVMALQRHSMRYLALASSCVTVGLVMGWGNPVLMSPVMTSFQAIILYWLRDLKPNAPLEPAVLKP